VHRNVEDCFRSFFLSFAEVLGMRRDDTSVPVPVPAPVDILVWLLWLWLLRLSGIRMYSVVLLARSSSTYIVRTILPLDHGAVQSKANKVWRIGNKLASEIFSCG
jgi:hypothetical protein